jgi:hypothetical protein
VLRRTDGSLFAASRASYLDAAPGQLTRRDAKVYVRIAVGSPGFTTTAMLDTGSTYSVLDADVAGEWGAFDEADAPAVELATRHGLLRGQLVRRQVWLLADEGESLEVDATFWVSPQWRHGHFLGYAGFLQRIRFALEPLTNSLYFGPALD